MNYPDFSFRTQSEFFDKDAQGAHQSILTFRHQGEDFVCISEEFDAYQEKWSLTERKGKIIAYFPEKKLVKLRYEQGQEVFLELDSQKIDSREKGFVLHFYHQPFFPAQTAQIAELCTLFSAILSEIEQKNILFEPPVLENKKWTFSKPQAEFLLSCWFSENQHLEISLRNPFLYQVPYGLSVGAYPSNLYINALYLSEFEEKIKKILHHFIEKNPTYSVSRA